MKYLLITVLSLSPLIASAQGLKDIIRRVYYLVDIAIPIAFALALLAFFWGLAHFILLKSGSETAREDGSRIMIWGVVALFVMTSIWGIVRFMQGELGIFPTGLSAGSTANHCDNGVFPNTCV